MRTIFTLAWKAFQSAQQRRASAQALDELDERTLRDIGFDAEANARREHLRHAAARFRML
jgi:uncharacterized protein YjiS (DUF1127 family)